MTGPRIRFFLQNDAGTGWLADNLGNIGSSARYNSQCSFNTDDTTVSLIGTSLTLYLPISFSESFGGSKIISMMAVGRGRVFERLAGSWNLDRPVEPCRDERFGEPHLWEPAVPNNSWCNTRILQASAELARGVALFQRVVTQSGQQFLYGELRHRDPSGRLC